MSYQDRLAVVTKIIELRDLFIDLIEKNKDFDAAYERIADEIISFGKKTNVGIDIVIILMEAEKFEYHVKSDLIREFINMEIIKS